MMGKSRQQGVSAALKGKTNCNRTDCQIPLDSFTGRWWNLSTEAYYCGSCAREINKRSPGLLLEELPCRTR